VGLSDPTLSEPQLRQTRLWLPSPLVGLPVGLFCLGELTPQAVELIVPASVTVAQVIATGRSRRSTTPSCTPPMAPKRWHPIPLEIHVIIRRALGGAVRRGLLARNIAIVADALKLRSIPRVEQHAWDAHQLRSFVAAGAGHQLFPAFWLAATTGTRRSELLGLLWGRHRP
jgi:hypothetical protein